MSLINQLLVDLDQRQARLTGRSDLFALGVSPPSSPSLESSLESLDERRYSKQTLAGISLLILVLSFILFTWFWTLGIPFFKHHLTTQEKQEPPPNLPVSALTTLPVPMTIPAPGVNTPTAAVSPEMRSVMAPLVVEEVSVTPSGMIVAPDSQTLEPPPAKPNPSFSLVNHGNNQPFGVSTTPRKIQPDTVSLKPTTVMASLPNVRPIRRPIAKTSASNSIKDNISNITSVGLENPNAKPMTATAPASMSVTRSKPTVSETAETVLPLQKAQSLTWARTLLEDGQFEEAEKVIKSQVATEGESPTSLGMMAVLEQKRGNLETSNRYYNRLLRMEPDQYRWWLGIAVNMDQSKRKNEAISFYKHVLKMERVEDQVTLFAQERLRVLEAKASSETSR